MFRFSLDVLHKVRKRKEEERQKELAEVMKALKQEETALDGFRNEITNKLHEQNAIHKTGYDNNISILYDRFQAGRKLDVQEKLDLIERINDVADDKRKSVLKAYLERKVIDNFKTRKQEEHRVEEQKAEEKEIGEMVTMGFKHFRAKSHWCLALAFCFSFMTFPACSGSKVSDVEKMNQAYEASQKNEDPSVTELKTSLEEKNRENHQLQIEMENMRERMIEMERTQYVPDPKPVTPPVVEASKPQQPVKQSSYQSYKSKTPKELYKLGYNAIVTQNTEKARSYFNDFLNTYPENDLADNSLYWLGETYYGEQDYKTAIHYFMRVIKEYPMGNKVPDSYLKIAYSYQKLGRKSLALKSLGTFIEEFPKSSLRSKADKKLQEIKKMK